MFCFIHVHTHCQEVIQWFKSAYKAMIWISRSLYHCPVPPAFIRGLRLLISVHSTPPVSIRDLHLLEALRLLEVLRYMVSFTVQLITGGRKSIVSWVIFIILIVISIVYKQMMLISDIFMENPFVNSAVIDLSNMARL